MILNTNDVTVMNILFVNFKMTLSVSGTTWIISDNYQCVEAN